MPNFAISVEFQNHYLIRLLEKNIFCLDILGFTKDHKKTLYLT